MTILADIGATSLWLLYGWLLCSYAASYLSERKGYSEKAGLASGLLLYAIGPLIWLLWPAREDSKWKKLGPFGRGQHRLAADAAE